MVTQGITIDQMLMGDAEMTTKHTIAVLVNDQPGVLQRVSGLFGRRGFNIESITVGQSEEVGLSRMVIVTTGDDNTLEQIYEAIVQA